MTIELFQSEPGTVARGVSRSKPSHPSELVFVDRLQLQLRRRWSVLRLGREVRSHGRARIDLVLEVSGETGPLLIAIEAKLTDARRAVHQAILNRFVAELSYVAMPSAAVTPFALHFAAVNGIGVIAVDSDRAVEVSPATTGSPDPVLREKVSSALSKVRSMRTEPQFPMRGGM